MRKRKLSTLLLSGFLVLAAGVTGVVLLTAGRTSPTSGIFPAAPSQAVATTTALSTSTASPAPQGAPLKLTATVTPPAAAGTVQFKDGSANIGDPVSVRNGNASTTTSTLTVGQHQLTAVFAPTNPAAYTPSTSPAVPFTISGGTATSTVLSTSASSPVPQGTSLTLTATLTPASAVGTVQFKDGSTNIGDPVVVSNGTATQTTSTLTVGQHQLTAVFTPTNTALHGPSTSAAVPFTISGATATSSILDASSTATPAVVGSTVTLTDTVTPAAAAGTAQFQDNGTNIGDAVTVTNGTASTTTTTLTAGSHQLTAVFTPTTATLYSASTSPVVTFVVAGATTTGIALTTSPSSRVMEGTPVTMTVRMTPSTAAGTVQFRDGTTPVGAPMAVTNGIVSRSATLGVASHQLTAVFTPTTATLYSPSTSQTVTFIVDPQPLVAASAARNDIDVTPRRRQDPPGDLGPQTRRPGVLGRLGRRGIRVPQRITNHSPEPVWPRGDDSPDAVNDPTRRWANQ